MLATIPFLLTQSPAVIATGATGMICISYFLCNLGVFAARRRGWPHRPAFFSLGSWGTVINVVALVWGGLMIINFATWQSEIFGSFGTATYTLPDGSLVPLRDLTNPPLSYISINGEFPLPAIPIFEAVLGVVLIVGLLYYVVAVRSGREEAPEMPDLATGEATIG